MTLEVADHPGWYSDQAFYDSLEDRPFVDDPMIILYGGPKGSGKTLSLAIAGGFLLVQGQTVWSNFPIDFYDNWGNHYQSLPLKREDLWDAGPELQDGFALIQEAQYWFNHRQAMSTNNALMAGFVQAVRHRNLTVLGDVKWLELIDRDIRPEVDVWVQCSDAYRDPGAKQGGVKKGTLIHQHWRDLSGAVTGRTYVDFPMEYPQDIVHAERYWHIYDSRHLFAITDIFARVKVHAEATHLGPGGGEKNAALAKDIKDALMDMLQGGHTELSARDMWEYLAEKGISGDHNVLGRLVRGLGVTQRTGHRTEYYSLAGMVQDGQE